MTSLAVPQLARICRPAVRSTRFSSQLECALYCQREHGHRYRARQQHRLIIQRQARDDALCRTLQRR